MRRKGPVFQRGLRQVWRIHGILIYLTQSERPRFSEGIETTLLAFSDQIFFVIGRKGPVFQRGLRLCNTLSTCSTLLRVSERPRFSEGIETGLHTLLYKRAWSFSSERPRFSEGIETSPYADYFRWVPPEGRKGPVFQRGLRLYFPPSFFIFAFQMSERPRFSEGIET